MMAGKAVGEVVLRCEEAKQTGILNLKSSKLVSIPAAVYFLVKEVEITQCSLAHNCLRSFPKQLPLKFPKLKVLNLRGNALTDLPEQIGLLESLEALDLSENALVTVNPEHLKSLDMLKILNLSSNKIQNLNIEEFVKKLPKLKTLILTGNPFDEKTTCDITKYEIVMYQQT